MNFDRIPYLTWAIWVVLAAATLFALATAHWSNVFVIVTALFLTVLPSVFLDRFDVRVPLSFLAALSAFVFGTLFLGEVFDFYNRFWWWDVLLHGASAVGLGIIGFVFIFTLFQGDKYAAPPWAIAVLSFAFALAIGAIWEIFEFSMDQFFGLNMQKSGLNDTMSDLIVDSLGAGFASLSGFFWLKGRQVGVAGMIAEFVALNRTGARRIREKAAEVRKRGDAP
jgi:hypothetical protein